MAKLFDPLQVGNLRLHNRIVMAPLTRNRAPGGIPTPMMAQYYSQRANAGLLISEGTAISAQGQGYSDVPGLYGIEQLDGWKQVTRAVHEHKGRIFVQLWHVGRVSHVDLQPNGLKPVAPSPIAAKTRTYIVRNGVGGFAPTSEPRELDADEIPGIVQRDTPSPPPASMASKCTRPTATCWTSSSRPAPTNAATTTAAPSRTAPACCWKSCARWPAKSAAAAPACAFHR